MPISIENFLLSTVSREKQSVFINRKISTDFGNSIALGSSVPSIKSLIVCQSDCNPSPLVSHFYIEMNNPELKSKKTHKLGFLEKGICYHS